MWHWKLLRKIRELSSGEFSSSRSTQVVGFRTWCVGRQASHINRDIKEQKKPLFVIGPFQNTSFDVGGHFYHFNYERRNFTFMILTDL